MAKNKVVANDPDESFNLPEGVEDDLPEEQIESYFQQHDEIQRDVDELKAENDLGLEAWVRN